MYDGLLEVLERGHSQIVSRPGQDYAQHSLNRSSWGNCQNCTPCNSFSQFSSWLQFIVNAGPMSGPQVNA